MQDFKKNDDSDSALSGRRSQESTVKTSVFQHLQRPSTSKLPMKKKYKRDISPTEFDYIYRKNIRDQLQKEGQLYFSEINLLLISYEQYRFEKKSKKTIQQIEKQENQG